MAIPTPDKIARLKSLGMTGGCVLVVIEDDLDQYVQTPEDAARASEWAVGRLGFTSAFPTAPAPWTRTVSK